MPREFVLVMILVVLCCAIVAVGLVLAFRLITWSLAKGFMGFLRQLYGNEHDTENHNEHRRGREEDCSLDGPGAVRGRSARRG